jgi:hypothetical protein
VMYNHQDITILVNTMLLTAIYIDTSDLLYPYISAMNDILIREISLVSDFHAIINSESMKNILIPEMYLENLSDNGVILEWWVSEIEGLSESQMVEYRFSYYQGSEGLSRVIERGTMQPANISLNLDGHKQIIKNLIDFLQ